MPSEVLQSVPWLLTAAGLFFTWAQLRINTRLKRSEFIVSEVYRFLFDEDTLEIYYEIEYDRLRYPEHFHDSVQEKKIDKLLAYFERLGALFRLGTITLQEIGLIEYELLRVYRAASIQEYLKTMDRESRQLGQTGVQYRYFRELCKTLSAPKGRLSSTR